MLCDVLWCFATFFDVFRIFAVFFDILLWFLSISTILVLLLNSFWRKKISGAAFASPKPPSQIACALCQRNICRLGAQKAEIKELTLPYMKCFLGNLNSIRESNWVRLACIWQQKNARTIWWVEHICLSCHLQWNIDKSTATNYKIRSHSA